MKTFEVGGVKETVFERGDYAPSKLKAILSKETVAVLGYGPQGRAQSLNLRDNGVKVYVVSRRWIDQAKGIEDPSFGKAIADGWVPGKTLIESIPDGVRKATVVIYLLSDAGQKACWPLVGPHLQPGAALYFSHGFSIAYSAQTGVVPPKNVDVILVAPKGSGRTVRDLFLAGGGINCSFAVGQDATGRARERCMALGIGIGCGFLFETTFQKEVFSDLTGERSCLMGGIAGMFKAQYEVLRAKGHSPLEAFNETVEEATQSLYKLIGDNGMDWMYANCSATAQRGALDWAPKFHDAIKPVIAEIYRVVESGEEAKHVLEVNGQSDYQAKLAAELKALDAEEIWQAGRIVRELRPERILEKLKAKAVKKPAKKAAAKPKPKAKAKKAGKKR